HNSGERLDGAGKLLVPVNRRNIVRLFGMYSVEQRLLYDPAYKYDPTFAPASRVRADLFTAQLQHTAAPESQHPLNADLRVGYFDRAFVRGALSQQPVDRFGGFTGQRFHFLGEGIAERQDTVAARGALPGFTVPQMSESTPWGVPAFFLGGAPRGEIAWNHFRELRSQLDVTLAGGPSTDFYLGGEFAQQHVNTFQRVFAYQPVDSTIPPPTASTFAPQSAALYAEMQTRAEDIAVTFGLRYDQFDPRTQSVGRQFGARRAISPRLAVSTVLKGATVVASWGRFAQAPDFQYLVDAAFDDTLRTGRFRRGNPDLGFENATQYEFSVRARPSPVTSVRVNGYIKRLDGLVASVPIGVNPDSAIFANGDFGSVKGAELIVEREMRDWWGARVSYAFMNAEATSTSPFLILQNISIGPTGDTIRPARVQFPLDYDRHHSLTVVLQARAPESFGPRIAGLAPLAGWELAVIGHYNSGLPYTRTNLTGDTLVGLPNSFRLPPQTIIDLRLRRPLVLGGWRGSVYFDARNLLNTRNLESVRRETGTPGATTGEIQALAQAAYNAHPEAIPYESPRYRAWADVNHDGVISGIGELMPLYMAAAQDFTQPIFAYGPPRLIRLGVELEF
ncbi:MAG TPA: TonB-dependent receptor, partial [Gemmatimonadales bacterium]|nr:TonB-dependent receptor [Gemmatimonadales bacterium]